MWKDKLIINIDIKSILILLLGVALVLSFIFRPSVPIEEYEEEISILQKQNKKLLISNDSIVKANIRLQKEIDVILYTIDSTKVVLRKTESKLKELERKRNEVSDIVDNMDSDDVTNTISDYLKRRGKDNN
jgi:predicted proteasome-type protease